MAEDFDPCECVFSHEGAMRRLISLLRNSQAYCTPEECFTTPPGPVVSQSGGSDGTLMMMCMGWVLLALVLFFMRPASLSLRGDKKPSNNQKSIVLHFEEALIGQANELRLRKLLLFYFERRRSKKDALFAVLGT